jgi:hypothetical protein
VPSAFCGLPVPQAFHRRQSADRSSRIGSSKTIGRRQCTNSRPDLFGTTTLNRAAASKSSPLCHCWLPLSRDVLISDYRGAGRPTVASLPPSGCVAPRDLQGRCRRWGPCRKRRLRVQGEAGKHEGSAIGAILPTLLCASHNRIIAKSQILNCRSGCPRQSLAIFDRLISDRNPTS